MEIIRTAELILPGHNDHMRRVYSIDGICPTLTTCPGGGTQHKILVGKNMIRRLTEQESFRLQGYNEEEIKTLAENFSMSRCYRLAGNSITVDVLESIFESIFEELGENTFNQH